MHNRWVLISRTLKRVRNSSLRLSIGRMGWNPLLRILLRVTNPNPERVPAATTALLCRDGSGLLGFSFKSRTGVGSDLLPSYWHKSVL